MIGNSSRQPQNTGSHKDKFAYALIDVYYCCNSTCRLLPQGDDPMRAIVGVASIPMASLAAGVPVEGAFKLTNPITKRPAGRIILGMGWHNPLQLPGTAPQGQYR